MQLLKAHTHERQFFIQNNAHDNRACSSLKYSILNYMYTKLVYDTLSR